MGRETEVNSLAEQPLWQRYAGQFPVRENLVYLNHAAVAPLPRCCADALKHLADDALHYGSLHYDEWLAVYHGLRVATARLINSDPAEIALVKNTSEGIATLALGLDWRPGDRMVGFQEEFPANQYPWKRLEAKGIEGTWLFSARCQGLPHRCSGSRRAQVVTGPGRVCHPLHKPGTSGPRGARRVRLDQRGRLRRLRLPRYDPAAGCRPISVRNSKYYWMLWIKGIN